LPAWNFRAALKKYCKKTCKNALFFKKSVLKTYRRF
jgi:hypothetical protein